jgi:hypothetical protein
MHWLKSLSRLMTLPLKSVLKPISKILIHVVKDVVEEYVGLPHEDGDNSLCNCKTLREKGLCPVRMLNSQSATNT